MNTAIYVVTQKGIEPIMNFDHSLCLTHSSKFEDVCFKDPTL